MSGVSGVSGFPGGAGFEGWRSGFAVLGVLCSLFLRVFWCRDLGGSSGFVILNACYNPLPTKTSTK